ncbi:acetyltransferase (GNAT) family protein [Pseudonocardia endophytica]|uniref:Acetyltransferase (GNAT) family protein n=1 Tax=Pseudonocardia endophytica TaxID=401976 RepID=A0A4R1HN40_PSEEN|nr:acetyltransferase (GNAT) family protein [Pseudonocardia endophytica]
MRYFTAVDHRDHEALGAVTVGSGDGVVIARYIRDTAGPGCAELVIVVLDAWQRRGVGRELMRVLCRRAREEGITAPRAEYLSENPAVPALLRRFGHVQTEAAGSTSTAVLDLTATPTGDAASITDPSMSAASCSWRIRRVGQTVSCFSRRSRHAALALLLASVIGVAGCAGGSGRGGTDQPGVPGPASVAPGPAGATQRTSLAMASVKDVQAALRTNDVDDPEYWAQVLIEARPYPAGQAGEQKLREVLARFRADPDTTGRITNTLTP